MEIRKFFVRSETACAEISAQVFSTRLCERGIPQGEDGFRVVFSHTRGKEDGDDPFHVRVHPIV